jgi:hypothetical protein
MIRMPEATSPPADAIEWAISAAIQSPCQKSKRGVAIFGNQTGTVVANGCNHLPADGLCGGSEECRTYCRFRCVHAEVMAIRRALVVLARSDSSLSRDWHRLRGHDAIHVKVGSRKGDLMAGGGPSCLQCAREVLDVGLAGFWLYELSPHGPEWRRYTAEEFYAVAK